MSKRKQGHWCWVCLRYRANERFTGKSHARHICQECERNRKRLRKFQKGEHVLVLFKKRKLEGVVRRILMDEGRMILKVILFGKETDVEVDPLKVQKVT